MSPETSNFKHWQPRLYLDHYYSTPKITIDEKKLLKVLVNFLKVNNFKFKKAIEFGAGPTIHRIIPFIPYIENIYISDFLNTNLYELRKWLRNETDHYDWDKYIKYILECENNTNTAGAINRRSNLARKKITSLLEGNLFNKTPLQIVDKFPLVTSFYCADSITHSKKKWYKLMINLYSLLTDKGWIFISSLRNAKFYKVGNIFLPGANINENDIKKSFMDNGFRKESINIEVIPTPWWIDHGFDGTIIASAQKI